jgi:NAD(P)-dependent dehydrogenase (short-subunit alcohol dehydrogenase family)
VQLDVTSPASVARGVDEALAATDGRLDALVLNAGYATAGFFEDLTDDDCRRLFETNLFGSFALVRAILPVLRAQRAGHILAVSSNAANLPHPMFSTYAASKWAVEGWCEALAVEVAPFGIDVTVVQPGNYRTSFGDNVVPVAATDSVYGDFLARAAPQLERVGRYGRDPREVGRAMADLLEDPRPPFRLRLGPDDRIAAVAKALLPYRARAWAIRRITGIPGRQKR